MVGTIFLPQLYLQIGHELDLSETYLSIVPGMEGHYQRFHSMCESLKLPAVVLQPGLDFLSETPIELAQRYSKVKISLSFASLFRLYAFFYFLSVILLKCFSSTDIEIE